MKDVFRVHARRIHLMSGGKCPLTMKLANLKQGIEILELFQHILPRVNPVDDRLSTDLQNKPSSEDIRWSMYTRPAVSVECQLLVRSVQDHNDMYFVRIFDVDGRHEQAFFKHLDIHDVMAQLKKLITRWKKELEKAESNSQLTNQMIGRLNRDRKTPEVRAITFEANVDQVENYQVGKRTVSMAAMIGEPMENRDGTFTCSEAYKRQRDKVLQSKKESE